MNEIPTGKMWSGRVIPTANGKNIFEFFNTHQGGDIILISKLAMKRFKLSKEDYEYWLGEWRFTAR